MAQITYENKVKINDNPSIPNINKVTDADMNEIKDVVNENYDEQQETTSELKNLIKITEMGIISSDKMTNTTIGGNSGKLYDLTFAKQYDTPPMVITNVYHDAGYGSYGIVPTTAANVTTTGCRLLLDANVSISNYGVKYIVISND